MSTVADDDGVQILPEEWDRLEVSFFWKGLSKEHNVDMDANCLLFNVDGDFLEAVHFGRPVSTDGAVRHMGDEIGHVGAGDQDSSEEVRVNLTVLNKNVFALVMVFTCYSGQLHHLYEAGVCVNHLSVLNTREMRRGLMAVSLARDDLLEKDGATAIIMARMFRVKEHDFKRWGLSLVGELAVVHQLEETVPASQRQLRDLIPHIVVRGEELLVTRVTDVIKLLSISNLKRLEANFPKFGCDVDTFLSLIMTELCVSNPKLRSMRQAEKLLGLLQEMASQIDIYGKNVIYWADFTTFCVDAETQSDNAALAKGAHCAVDVENKYVLHVIHKKDMTWRGFSRIRHLASEDLLACMEDYTATVRIIRRYNHELVQVFSLDPLHVWSQGTFFDAHRLSSAAAPDRVLDVEWVTTRALFIMTSTNQLLTFWYFSSRGYSKLLHSITSPVVLTRLMWVPRTQLLAAVGADHCLWMWAVETRRPLYRLEGHDAVVTDIRLAPGYEDEKVVTCSADQSVRFWNMSTMACDLVIWDSTSVKLVATCAGGVLMAAGHNSVVSVWDLHVKDRYCTCSPSPATSTSVPISVIHLLEYEDDRYGVQIRGITGTEDGVFKIWNLVKSDCRDGEALLLRTVSLLPTDSPGDAIAHDDLGRVTSAIAVTTNRNIWPDIYLSSHKSALATLRAEPQPPPRSPVTVLVYNTHDTSFITAEDARVRFWDLTTSTCQHSITLAHDVSSLTIEEPLNRRLYAGTINGEIYVISYLNGEVLGSCRPHLYPVVSLFYCPVTRLLISCAKFGRIIVHVDRREEEGKGIESNTTEEDEKAAGERHEGGGHRSGGDKHNGKASTDVLISLRTLQSGLLATVDCAAYSQEMGLIAAAGAGSCLITLWDFYSMDLKSVLGLRQGPARGEVLPDGSTSCLRFVPGYPLLVSGHTTGDVYVWELPHHGSKGGLRLRLTAGGGSALSKITCLSVDLVSVASAAGPNTTGSVVMTTVTSNGSSRNLRKKYAYVNVSDAHGEVSSYRLSSVLSELASLGVAVKRLEVAPPARVGRGRAGQVVGGARGKAASAYTRVSRTVKRGALKLFEERAAMQPPGPEPSDMPWLDTTLQWTAHEDGVLCHCCPVSPHPLLLTAGAASCSIRLWAMDKLVFNDKDFDAGGLMGEAITCDFESERIKKAARWAYPRAVQGATGKVSLKMKLLLAESIKESIRPAYLMRANSRRIMQRKTMAEKRAMTMLGGVNDDAGAEEEEEDVDEGEEEQGDQVDASSPKSFSLTKGSRTGGSRFRGMRTTMLASSGQAGSMNSTMMTMTMDTMAPALATHRNSRQDHNFPTMAAADFQHLPLLEMPKQGGALADLLRREVCGLEDTERRRVQLNMQKIRGSLRSSHLAKNLATGRVIYGNLYREQHRHLNNAATRNLKSVLEEAVDVDKPEKRKKRLGRTRRTLREEEKEPSYRDEYGGEVLVLRRAAEGDTRMGAS